MIKPEAFLLNGLALGVSLNVFAKDDIFRSVTDDGTVQFSDTANNQSAAKFKLSTPVVVPRLSEIPATGSYREGPDPESTPKTESNQPLPAAYQNFQILTPVDSEGGWIDGAVQVKLALSPQLKSGHEIILALDGNVVASGSTLNHALEDVYRGMHTLNASVRDRASGATLTTDTVQFQVHRRTDKTNTRMLHPSLQIEEPVDASNLDEILPE